MKDLCPKKRKTVQLKEGSGKVIEAKKGQGGLSALAEKRAVDDLLGRKGVSLLSGQKAKCARRFRMGEKGNLNGGTNAPKNVVL